MAQASAQQAQPEVKARTKHTCPACGGEALWNASKQVLACGFCGTEVPGTLDTAGAGKIEEHDLAGALRSIPDDKRGWGAQKQSVKCQSCHAISVFDAARQSQGCDFCGATQLVPYEEVKEAFSPESLLPMKIAASGARELIKTWYGSRWFAPNKLKKAALTDTVKGLYIPYWTFDAQANADLEAEAGYHYYKTEEYTDSSGNRQTRQIQRTRWEYASGSIDHFSMMSWCPHRSAYKPIICARWNHFRQRSWRRTSRRICRAGWSSVIKLTWSRRRAALARSDGTAGAAHVRLRSAGRYSPQSERAYSV